MFNQNVMVAIDWEKRYRLMKLHFAAELLNKANNIINSNLNIISDFDDGENGINY